jgi:hypothetical protein
MAVNIKLKHSSVDGKVPIPADLENGELALNINENSPAAYIKDSNGDIVKLAGAGSVTDEASVKKAGDNMTGDLTLGTDKITLDATDGSINAAGTLSLLGGDGRETNGTFGINSDARVNIRQDAGLNDVWNVYSGDRDTVTSRIKANGSAKFAGDVQVGGDTASSDGVLIRDLGLVKAARSRAIDTLFAGYTTGVTSATSEIKADGSVLFRGSANIGDYNSSKGNLLYADGGVVARRSDDSQRLFVGLDGATETFSVSRDGSSEFAGVVAGKGYGPDYAFEITDGNTNMGGLYRDSAGANLYLKNSAGDTQIFFRADGTGEFSGNITTGGYDITDGSKRGLELRSDGLVRAQRPGSAGSSAVWQGYNGTDNTSTIKSDGSAEFSGGISTGLGSANEGYLQTIGNGFTYGYIFATNTSGASVGLNFRDKGGTGAAFIASDSGGNDLAKINWSGGAEFSGNITAGSSVTSANPSIFYNNNNNLPALYCRNYGANSGLMVESISANIAFQIRDTTGNDAIAMYGNGNATFNGTVTATVVPPSDARFKENITPAKPQLADVVALGGLLKNYDWNDQAPLNEEIRSQRQLGLIAQEAAEVCPAIVKDIHRTKQGAVITPEEIIPAVVEPAHTIPAVTKEIPNPRPTKEGETITVEVTPAQEVPEKVIEPEKIIPATYETLDDSYKGISTDALIMKLLGAVTELSAEVTALKAAKLTKK